MVTMPPPEEASTRIWATSWERRSCICCACFIICCMLPGSFTPLLLQVSDLAHFSSEHVTETLYFGVGERACGQLVLVRRRGGLGILGRDLAGGHAHLHGLACNFPDRLIDLLRLQKVLELARRHEL